LTSHAHARSWARGRRRARSRRPDPMLPRAQMLRVRSARSRRRGSMLLSHGGSRESALLLQRGAVVGRFHYRIREEQSPATVAAAVAKRSCWSGRAGDRIHREHPPALAATLQAPGPPSARNQGRSPLSAAGPAVATPRCSRLAMSRSLVNGRSRALHSFGRGCRGYGRRQGVRIAPVGAKAVGTPYVRRESARRRC
jgi:hypothetical protein